MFPVRPEIQKAGPSTRVIVPPAPNEGLAADVHGLTIGGHPTRRASRGCLLAVLGVELGEGALAPRVVNRRIHAWRHAGAQACHRSVTPRLSTSYAAVTLLQAAG